jgi:hypothetical protein
MPKGKIPLPVLFERDKPRSVGGRYGWEDFVALMQSRKRLSYRALADMFGRTDKTMKVRVKRYDEERK